MEQDLPGDFDEEMILPADEVERKEPAAPVKREAAPRSAPELISSTGDSWRLPAIDLFEAGSGPAVATEEQREVIRLK